MSSHPQDLCPGDEKGRIRGEVPVHREPRAGLLERRGQGEIRTLNWDRVVEESQ